MKLIVLLGWTIDRAQHQLSCDAVIVLLATIYLSVDELLQRSVSHTEVV